MKTRRPDGAQQEELALDWEFRIYADNVIRLVVICHFSARFGDPPHPQLTNGIGIRRFFMSLLIAGLSSTPTELLIDRFGGRLVMAAGSLICGAGLIGLSQVQALCQYYAAWTVLGFSMAFVFYEAAFATINRAWTSDARSGISTVTLIAGFASIVFWPLTLTLNTMLGWRDTHLVCGVLQLFVSFYCITYCRRRQ